MTKKEGKKQDEVGKKKFTHFFSVTVQCVGEQLFSAVLRTGHRWLALPWKSSLLAH